MMNEDGKIFRSGTSDLVCGSSSVFNDGSKILKQIVHLYLPKYLEAKKSQKSAIITAVIEEVQRQGGFIHNDRASGEFFEAGCHHTVSDEFLQSLPIGSITYIQIFTSISFLFVARKDLASFP